MKDLPIVGAQLTVLDIDKHRDWLFEKNRDLELPEFCMADILRSPDPFIAMAKEKLDGWTGRLGIHGPYAGFDLDVKDRDIRAVVQTRLDQGLDVCAKLGARQMVIHSPYDPWDYHNLDNAPDDRSRHIAAVLETLDPAIARARELGVEMVLENVQDIDPVARLEVVRAANSPALRASVDTGHAHWAHWVCGAPPADRFITACGAELGHVHLQDTDGYADRHWSLGQGNIQWGAVMSAIAETKATPHLIVELNDFDRVQDSVAHLEALGLAQ